MHSTVHNAELKHGKKGDFMTAMHCLPQRLKSRFSESFSSVAAPKGYLRWFLPYHHILYCVNHYRLEDSVRMESPIKLLTLVLNELGYPLQQFLISNVPILDVPCYKIRYTLLEAVLIKPRLLLLSTSTLLDFRTILEETNGTELLQWTVNDVGLL